MEIQFTFYVTDDIYLTLDLGWLFSPLFVLTVALYNNKQLLGSPSTLVILAIPAFVKFYRADPFRIYRRKPSSAFALIDVSILSMLDSETYLPLLESLAGAPERAISPQNLS